MKGVVFTEFVEMVETKFGDEVMEEVIELAGVDGVYTSIGTYPHSDMIQLVSALSERTEIAIPDLLQVFGTYMFESFTRLYPTFFTGAKSAFDFLEQVEDFIHVEVKKIYPNAELPKFETKRISERQLQMIYHSDRSMGTLALGLIQGCLNHFKSDGEVKMLNLAEDGSKVNFLIELN